MDLNLVLGRAKSGKTEKIYGEMKKILENVEDSNIIFIVPEQMTYSTEMDIINRLELQGLIDIQVCSFNLLEKKVLDEVGGLTLEAINDYGKIMILKKLFSDRGKELEAFKGAVNKEGFLKEFNSFINELKRNNISFQDIEKIDIEGLDNNLLKRKLKDIIWVYKKLEEEKQAKFFDSEDRTNYFINTIEKSEYIKNSYIFIDNFEGIVQQRMSIIEKLIEHSKGVFVTVNMDVDMHKNKEGVSDSEIFNVTYDTFKKYMEIAGNLNIEPKIFELSDNYIKNPEIKAIEEALFKSKVFKYEAEQSRVNIVEATNPYEEMEFVARKIIELTRDNNYRYRDIAVVTGDIATYSGNAKKVFTQCNIPLFVDDKKDIMDNPFVKYVMSLLEMICNGYRRESVINFLKTRLTDIEYGDVEKLENYALEHGIDRSLWFKTFVDSSVDTDEAVELEGEDENNTDTSETEDDNFIEGIRVKFASSYGKYKEEFDKLKSVNEITEKIIEIMKKDSLESKLNNYLKYFSIRNQNEQASLYSQCWNAIMEAFSQIKMVSDNMDISVLDYKKILEAGFNEVKLSVIPPSLDKVMLGELDIAYINKYKAVFFVGVNDGVIPKKTDNAGVLLDEEKELLVRLNIPIINTAAFNDSKEKHILYKALCNDVDKLYICYSIGSITGKEMKESYYVYRFSNLFNGLKPFKIRENAEDIDNILSKSWSLNSLADKLRDYTKGKELSKVWKSVMNWFYRKDKAMLEAVLSGINFEYEQDNLQTIVDKLYGENIVMSVSKLETYVACPFKFFVEFGLKPAERRILKIESYQLGNIYHKAIENFINKIIEIGRKTPIAEQKNIGELMDQCLTEALGNSKKDTIALNYNKRLSYVKEKMSALLRKLANVIVYQISQGEFLPTNTEGKIDVLIKDLVNQFKDFNDSGSDQENPEETENSGNLGNDVDDKNSKGKKSPKVALEQDSFEDIYAKITEEEKAKIDNIRLIGRIDRVDICNGSGNIEDSHSQSNYLNVIDYKSSNKMVERDMALLGLQIQLFVYLEAAKIMLGKEGKDFTIGGGFYFTVDDSYVDEKEIEKLLKSAAKEESVEDVNLKEVLKNKYLQDHMLNGYARRDDELLTMIDRNIKDGKDSNVIDVKLRKTKAKPKGKSGKEGIDTDKCSLNLKESSKVLDNYESFINSINKTIYKNLINMTKGNVKISPMEEKGKAKSCAYCNYRGICKFDSSLKGFNYRKR